MFLRWLRGNIGFLEDRNFSEYFDAHSRDPAMVHAELSGGAHGKVDDPSSDVRTAIVDAHNDRLSGLEIDNSNLGAEGQALMCGGESIQIKALAAGRAMISIP